MLALRWRLCAALSFVFIFWFTSPAFAAGRDRQSVKIPLTFEPNKGQIDRRARFLARSGHGTVLLTDDGVILAAVGRTSIQSVQIRLLHAALPAVAGESPTGGFANYYRSEDSKQWLSHIPLFSQVRYSGIYPGIDVVFHGHQDQLEYDFEVSAGSSPKNISFSFEGADRIAVASDGGLDIISGAETWRLLAPVAYQIRGSVREPVKAAYRILADNSVGLRLGKFDRTAALIIDPVVQYGNIFSDNNNTEVKDVKVDAAGDLFITGDTYASDYPVVNGKSPNGNSSQQVYLTKLNPAGDTILFSTFIPTSQNSEAHALALDGSGNAYIAGGTSDPNFPVTSTNLGTCGQPCGTGFVTKFASDGSIVYSTLLSSGAVAANYIVVDANGNAYLAGGADSSLHTVNAFQATGPGVFFAKLDAAGQNYLSASYFSQPGHTGGTIKGLAVDGTGNIYIAGQQADGVPLVNAWEFSGNGLFLAKFAPDAKTLLFSTTFGSGGADTLSGLAVGSDGTVYLVGDAASAAYPFTLNAAAHPVLEDGNLMFATAVDPSLTKLTYSTYLGTGTLPTMVLDSANHLHIAGWSILNFLPLQGAVVSDVTSGGFVLELDSSGTPVFVSQFGGHSSAQIPTAIAVDSSNNTYVAGPYSPQNAFPPNQSDMIVIGPPMGRNTSFNYGSFFAKISPVNSPQLSVSTGPPFLVLRNPSSVDLHISNIALGGRLTNRFGNCGQTLPAGTSCVLTVLDNLNRIASGTVTITSDAQPAVQTFTVSSPYTEIHPGPVIGDLVIFQDVRFSYPPQLTGSTTNSIPMTVWNVGTQNAHINAITTNGSASETDNCNTQNGGALAQGTGCTVQVSVTAGGQPQLHFIYDTNFQADFFNFFVPVTQQSAVAAPHGIDFGIHHVNGISIPRMVTVTNTGGATISVQWSLQGDPSFVLAGNTCLSGFLDPHQSCVIGVQFNPGTNGRVSADLTIAGQQVQLFGTGEIPSVVQVSALELDYFQTIVGMTSSQDLGLINTSATAVPIAGFLFSLPDFSETDDCQGLVPASGSCTVHVTFAPQQLGPRNATLTVNFGNGALTQKVSLLGGVGVTPLSVTPGVLNFDSVLVGQTSTSQGVVIGNNQGKAQAYTLSLTGDFILTFSCSSFNPMPPFFGCVSQVAFQPKSAGQQQGSLTASYPGTSVQSVVTLNGNGIGGAPVVSLPATQDFGNPAVGSTVQSPITLKNTGNLPLTVSSMVVSGLNAADFNVPAGQCSTVAAGASCPIQVNFTPSVPLGRQATLTLNDDGLNSPQSMGLTGTGVGPFIDLLPPSLFVGQTFPGSQTSNQLLIGNGGNADLVINSLTFTGPNAAEFSADIQLCGVVHGASTCSIKLILSPVSGGPKVATLNINDNELGSPQTVSLTGTGIGPAINLPASVDFGLQPVGSTNQRVMNITNPGDQDLTISSALISGANAGDFKLANQCPLISPGGICGLQINFTPGSAGPRSATLNISDNAFGSPHTVALTAGTATPLQFVPVTPCRVADTRNPNSAFGGPFLSRQIPRGITIPNSACNISASAQAYSLNVTVVPHGPLGFVTTFPCGQALPVASTLNSIDGRAKAVAAIVPAGTNGDVCFYASDDTELVLDINGYFVPAATPNTLSFYPLPPCRLVDTRPPQGFTGAFGPPALVGGGAGSTPIRTFPIRGHCGLPATAQAYSLNFTTVPSSPLGYLAAWPADKPKPTVGSTLNAVTGTPTANAAIVPAAANGDISVFASDNTDLVLDVNGYFAPPGPGGLSLYNLTPCRVLDTRLPNNTGSPLIGQLDVDVHGSACAPPLAAQSYVLNTTVVPTTGLGFLTLWPQGISRPTVSTLNAIDSAVTSNMALVPTSNGSVSAYTSSASHLILDISGYFAATTSAPTLPVTRNVETATRDGLSLSPDPISSPIQVNTISKSDATPPENAPVTPTPGSVTPHATPIGADILDKLVGSGLISGAKVVLNGVRHSPHE